MMGIEGFLSPLDITDREFIDSVLANEKTLLSSYSFVSHYVWKDFFAFYHTIIDDFFCLFARYGSRLYMPLPPIPTGGIRLNGRIIPTVFEIMNSFNVNKEVSRIENIDECYTDFFLSQGLTLTPIEVEYIYRREDIAALKGNRYKSIRALYNHFVKNYGFEYEDLRQSHVHACLSLFTRWKKIKSNRNKDSYYQALMEDAHIMHKCVLENSLVLNIKGKVVKINGQIEGYIAGFLKDNILYILLEITNPEIKGLSQFIFREFCAEIMDATYVNVLGDSNIEGLRKAKLLYRPCRIVPSYGAYRE